MTQRLPGQMEGILSLSFDINVAMRDAEGLAGKSDQAFDVAELGLLGITEDDDIPAFRRPAARQEWQVVREHHHEDPVALETRLLAQLIILIAAVHADARVDLAGERSRVNLVGGVHRIGESTLRTGDLFVPAHQGRGHGSGRDHECLGFESPNDQRQDKGHHDGLDRVTIAFLGAKFSREGGWPDGAGRFGLNGG